MDETIIATQKVETNTAKQTSTPQTEQAKEDLSEQKLQQERLQAERARIGTADFRARQNIVHANLKQDASQTKIEEPKALLNSKTEAEALQEQKTQFTPNYDTLATLTPQQEKKVFSLKDAKSASAEKPRKKASRFHIILASIVLIVTTAWGISNIVTLSNLSAQYELNLTTYLSKLSSLDSASSLNDLFPTYPTEENSAVSIEITTNWFDRLCNFLGGLFGG